MARKESFAGQRYACDRPGCGKHYSRPDHLLRHKLNHDREKVLACDQCDRTFVRQDLLARHLERHALRGKTLGRWSGRQSEGGSSHAGPSNGKRRRRKSRSQATDEMGNDEDDDEDEDEDDDDEEDDDEGAHDDSLMLETSNSVRSQPQHYHAIDQSNLHPAMRQSMAPAISQLPYSSPFDRFDTSSSFGYITNSPSSAAQQYGYHTEGAGYAGLSSNLQSQQASIAPPMPYDVTYDAQGIAPPSQFMFPQTSNTSDSRSTNLPWEPQRLGAVGSTQANQMTRASSDFHEQEAGRSSTKLPSSPFTGSQILNPLPPHPQLASTSRKASASPEVASETMALLHSTVPGSSHFPFSAPSNNDYVADYDWLFDGTNPLMPNSDSAAQKSSEPAQKEGDTALTEEHEHQNTAGHVEGRGSIPPDARSTSMNEMGRDRAISQEILVSEPTDALRDLAFFAILQTDIPDEPAFDVDEATTARLLHFLSSLPELARSPLFTPAALRCYLHLFFTRLNAIYPLIHQPTFSAKSADAMLLSAMIVCGAHFADEAAHFLAERIGRKLWGAFVSFEDFRPARATLAMLQAMLITETFGKMMGTRPQHETAHLFHNFIVTLARRNAVFIQSRVRLPSAPEERWRAWAREEEKKRISLYSFLLDAQHATIFRHVPALSAFQIHLQLPCDDDEWSAKNAQEWSVIARGKQTPEPNFIAALKAALTSSDHFGRSHTPDNDVQVDDFKQLVLLHGLMSVAYDLQWKQQALLTAPDTSENIANWKERLLSSYETCKRRLDEKSTATAIDRASYSLIEWAQIVLHSDAVDIQIYAGLPTVMGRFIDHHTFSIARKSCREWAKTPDALTAVWNAARFLRATLLPKAQSDTDEKDRSSVNGVDTLLHHQWVQYLSSLVIWAYEQAVSPVKQQAVSRARSQDRDSVASVPIADGQDEALQNQTALQAQNALSRRAQDEEVSTTEKADKAVNAARIYLDYVGGTLAPPNMIDFDPPHQHSTAVLELVEKECRGSRWELGREASGVLRKLIRERHVQSNNTLSMLADSSCAAIRRTGKVQAPDATASSSAGQPMDHSK